MVFLAICTFVYRPSGHSLTTSTLSELVDNNRKFDFIPVLGSLRPSETFDLLRFFTSEAVLEVFFVLRRVWSLRVTSEDWRSWYSVI